MSKYLANVVTESRNDGCFDKTFEVLGDELRTWARQCAESFRQVRKDAQVKLIVVRNGDCLANAREFAL